MKKSARPNLIHRRHRLCLQDNLILPSAKLHPRQTVEVGLGRCLDSDETLEEIECLESRVVEALRALLEVVRDVPIGGQSEVGELIDAPDIGGDASYEIRTISRAQLGSRDALRLRPDLELSRCQARGHDAQSARDSWT